MKNKRVINIFIFSIAVIMLLLRPYMVYKITENPNLSGNPFAANSLLQRLIKKKDDHHATSIQDYSAIHQTAKRKYPVIPFTAIKNNFALPSKYLIAIADFGQSTIFKVCAPHKYYRLLSKYQI